MNTDLVSPIAPICVNLWVFNPCKSVRNFFIAKGTSIIVPTIIIFIIIISCSGHRNQQNKINSSPKLIKFIKGDVDEPGVPCGYINEKGDTVIPIGKYLFCYTDTIETFGIVGQEGERFALLGIDQNDSVLFEVYWFDNGPDYPRDGLFRIISNDKIGYADSLGQIVIQPQFKCANPFENGRARVALDCKVEVRDVDGHGEMVSDSWFYIDTNGNRIN
jgi:hypothetical protein